MNLRRQALPVSKRTSSQVATQKSGPVASVGLVDPGRISVEAEKKLPYRSGYRSGLAGTSLAVYRVLPGRGTLRAQAFIPGCGNPKFSVKEGQHSRE